MVNKISIFYFLHEREVKECITVDGSRSRRRRQWQCNVCNDISKEAHIEKHRRPPVATCQCDCYNYYLSTFCECIILCELKTCPLYSSEAFRGHHSTTSRSFLICAAFHKFLLHDGIKTNKKDKNARRVNHHIKVVVSLSLDLGYLSKNLALQSHQLINLMFS